jgi:hypothetical protein
VGSGEINIGAALRCHRASVRLPGLLHLHATKKHYKSCMFAQTLCAPQPHDS